MILVLGGAGYIGSHVAKLLRKRNIPHVIADNLEKGHRSACGESTFVQVDVRDANDINDCVSSLKPDGVMHFASYISVGESMKQPDNYIANNFGGSKNLLNAMAETGVKKIIFSSSAAVYGEPDEIPISEDHSMNPTNTYGQTKKDVEELLQDFGRRNLVRSVSLRYFNAAGADPEGELGEDHRPEEHLIPIAIDAALGRRNELAVFGNDYETKDGSCIRDYIHVTDLAEAHLLAWESLEDETRLPVRTYNLGSENGFSVFEVIEVVEQVTGLKVPYKIGERREGDPARLVASCQKIKRELGWSPRYPELATIVQHAFSWREKHPNGYDDRNP
jgi:UDP-glucose 4-epimerase